MAGLKGLGSFGNFLPGLKSLVGSPRVLGIDIGTTSIKAVEIAVENEALVLKNYGILENYGHLERINDAIQTSSLKIVDDVTADMLKQLLKEMKPQTKTAVMSIPVFSGFVTVMELPQMTEKEISQAVPFEARQYIPIPITEVALDWMNLGPVPGSESGRIQVLLIAVPQDVISKYQRIADLTGLKASALEIEVIALNRSVMALDQSTAVLLDIGARSTTISIVDQGYVRMTRGLDAGGGDLTQVISSGMGIAPRRAEELKRERGIVVTPGREDIVGLLLPQLDAILLETQKFMQLYVDKTKREIKKIVVTGGSSHMPGLIEYMAKELNKETILGNPFTQVRYDPSFEPILKEVNSSLAVSVGLALRQFAT